MKKNYNIFIELIQGKKTNNLPGDERYERINVDTISTKYKI